MNPIRQYRKKPVVITAWQTDIDLYIKTLEGEMHASPGDWIITGVNGEQYPCKPDIFEKTYEPADLEPTPDARELADGIEAVAVSFDDTILDSLGDRLLKVGEYYWDSKKAANIITAYRARILDEAADRGLRYYENTDIAHRSGEGLYRAISGHDRAAVRGEVEK